MDESGVPVVVSGCAPGQNWHKNWLAFSTVPALNLGVRVLGVTLQAVVGGIVRLPIRLLLAVALACPAMAALAGTNSYWLGRSSSPTNNPLKGFMPYSGNYTTFPHSMEWNYLSLRALMSSPTNFDWSSLETLLSSTHESNKHQ